MIRLTTTLLLLVVSDHGFRGTDRLCNINELLNKSGMLKFTPMVQFKRAIAPMIGRLKLRNLTNTLYSTIRPQKELNALASERLVGSVMVDKSRVWALAYARSNYTSLFVNPSTVDANPEGFLSKMINELEEAGIIQPEDVFSGHKLQDALGLIMSYNSRTPQTIILARSPWSFQGKPRLGSIFESTELIGIHDMEGCLMMWGKGVKAKYNIQSATVFDIMQTILYALDLPLESDFDGQPLIDSFTFKNRIRMYDRLTGAIWDKAQQSERVRNKLDKLFDNQS